MKKTKTPLYVLFGADIEAAQWLIAQLGRYSRPMIACIVQNPADSYAQGYPVMDIAEPPQALASRIARLRLQAQADSVWLLWPVQTPADALLALLCDPVLAAHCALQKIVWYESAPDAPRRLAGASQAAREQLAQCDLLVLADADPKTLKQARRVVTALQPDIETVSTRRPPEVAAALGSRNLLQPLRVALVLAACVLLLLLLPRMSFKVADSIAIYLGTLLQALPFLMLGILLSSAIQVFIPADFLQRIFPKNLLGGMLFGLLGGFVLPVCDCASVPVFRSLVKKGVPVPAAVTFMLSAPVINPVVMLSTFYAFGGNVRIMFTRMAFGVLCSLLIGLLFARRGQDVLLSGAAPALCACGHSHRNEARESPDAEAPHREHIACACGHSHGNEAHESPDAETPHREHIACACGHSHGYEAHENRDAEAPYREHIACACGHSHGNEAHESPDAEAPQPDPESDGHASQDTEAPLFHGHSHGMVAAPSGGRRHPALTRMRRGLAALLAHFTEEFFEVVRYLLIGVAVSTVMQLLLAKALPGVSITSLPMALLFMMAMAFLLSLCSSSDAVVGKNMGASLPMGAVMGFLVFGPMMDIKNLILMSASFTRRFMLELLLATVAVCFAAVYLVYALGLGAMLT